MSDNPFDFFDVKAAVPQQDATKEEPAAAASINIMAQPDQAPVPVMNAGVQASSPMAMGAMNGGAAGMPAQQYQQQQQQPQQNLMMSMAPPAFAGGGMQQPPPSHMNGQMVGGMGNPGTGPPPGNMGNPGAFGGSNALVPSPAAANPYANMLGIPSPQQQQQQPPPSQPGQDMYGAQPQPPAPLQAPVLAPAPTQPPIVAVPPANDPFGASPPPSFDPGLPVQQQSLVQPAPSSDPFGASPPVAELPVSPAAVYGQPPGTHVAAAPPSSAVVPAPSAGDPFGIFGAPSHNAPTQPPPVQPPADIVPVAAPVEEAGSVQGDPWADMGFDTTPAETVPTPALTTTTATAARASGDLPPGGEWYDARIFTPTLGVMFFKPQELTDSLFLQTEKTIVDALEERPVVAFIVEGSSARSAGVELGHVLLKVNGIDVKNPKEASRLIKEGPRPLPLLFYVPDTTVIVAEGEHMVKYDTRDTGAPSSAKDFKSKYVVIGGIIAQPWMMNMYRSKVSFLA